jgi:UDP-glucose 4-epimerase
LAALIGIPYSYAAPESYFDTNVRGALNLFEACRDRAVGRILHTSTSEVYGTARAVPIDERHPLQAQSPYSASKIAADKLAESYILSFGLPVTTVRPFNTYGPRQSFRAVIPTILSQALCPACKEIRLGSLNPIRDLTYVEDTARAYCEIAEAPADTVRGRLYNLGTGAGVSVGDLAEKIQQIVGCAKPLIVEDERVRPEASEVRRLISDPSRVESEVGWKASTTLDEGLARTAEWLRRNPPPPPVLGHYVV